MTDGQAGARIEEVQVTGVKRHVKPLSGFDTTARRGARRPLRLPAGQGDGRVVVFIGDRLAEAWVLDDRGFDSEYHVDLTAEFLGDVGLHRHSGPARIGQRGVLEVGRPDTEYHIPVEITLQAGPGLKDRRRDREAVIGEDDAGPRIAHDLGGDEVHRRGADEPGDEQIQRRLEEPLWAVGLLQLAISQTAKAFALLNGSPVV